MECIAVCPQEDALQFALPLQFAPDPDGRPAKTAAHRWWHRALKPQMVGFVLAVIFFTLVGAARAAGHWQTNIPRAVYMQLVPNADRFDH
jgi:hypothetical protein